jgi:hypothetical protein
MRLLPAYLRRIAVALLCAAATLLTSGCGGSDVGKVAGRVTIGGKPLGQGAVMFQNTQTGAATLASLSNDGTYQAKTSKQAGLSPGDYQVAIQPSSTFTGKAPLVTPPTQEKRSESPIPPKFRSTKTSGLKVTVKQGNNPSFDFDLAK